MLKLALAALLLGVAAALPLPKTPIYCPPVAYRDFEVVVGRSAIIRPQPGCQRPSLIRKVSDLTGLIGEEIRIDQPTPNNFLAHVWLFASHLEYTLDGRRWLYLRLTP
ncbi:hypothetical protein [Deinococcus altitudinis]|uniref:hypothetical protein n=1 Tax=Deinococcus altitudinis TaxID=468914 RepID=UPI0038912BB1